MRWSDINLHPSCRTVRQFAVLWLAFFGGLALWDAALERPWQALSLAAAAVLGGVGGLIKPPMLRPIYTGWMVLMFPLGWAVSHLLLTLLFFGVITPMATVLHFFGRDVLRRRCQPGRGTYWVPKAAAPDVRRYFRPY
jgi:Saxitoxin biosynthesis operon protein SxtJ